MDTGNQPSATTPPTREVNILILGETGVGKSTFINAFANYLKFKTLEDALKAQKLHAVVPSSFTVNTYDDEGNFVSKKILSCDTDENENRNAGESTTQVATPYDFRFGDTLIRLFDTPGIGDARGTKKVKFAA